MADHWCLCDPEHETVKPLVDAFLNNYAEILFLPENHGTNPRGPQDMIVYRFLDSYMNHVIKVRLKSSPDVGFIVKMAPPCMQCPGVALPAPVERGESEYRAFVFFNVISPGCVPTPLFYDESARCLCTTELTGHRALSEELMEKCCSTEGARLFASRLAAIHSASHVITVGEIGISELCNQFPNREVMLTLIKTFHYTRPFDPSDSGKRCADEVKLMLGDVYFDADVIGAKEKVSKYFMENKESVIHGDLHVDSVIVDGSDFRMVDAEFVRVGPCAYDLGLLLATVLLVYHRLNHECHLETQLSRRGSVSVLSIDTRYQKCQRQGQSGASRGRGCFDGGTLHQNVPTEDVGAVVNDEEGNLELKSQGYRNAAKAILSMCSVILSEYTGALSKSLKQDKYFTKNLLRDIASFMGIEILSCIIGPSHFDFMDARPTAQVDCVKSAVRLLKNLHRINSVDSFMNFITMPSAFEKVGENLPYLSIQIVDLGSQIAELLLK